MCPIDSPARSNAFFVCWDRLLELDNGIARRHRHAHDARERRQTVLFERSLGDGKCTGSTIADLAGVCGGNHASDNSEVCLFRAASTGTRRAGEKLPCGTHTVARLHEHCSVSGRCRKLGCEWVSRQDKEQPLKVVCSPQAKSSQLWRAGGQRMWPGAPSRNRQAGAGQIGSRTSRRSVPIEAAGATAPTARNCN